MLITNGLEDTSSLRSGGIHKQTCQGTIKLRLIRMFHESDVDFASSVRIKGILSLSSISLI